MDEIIVPGTLESLDEVGAFVMSVSEIHGLEKRQAYRLRLAVDEITTNIITHGYQEAGLSGDVRLESEFDGTAVIVRIYDTGSSYDPGDSMDVGDLKRPLEDRPIGGLGVFLSIQSVDRFSYERKNGVNCHTFVVNK